MENSDIIFVSDHGQLFERGYHGHITEMLYESLIHTPLMIRAPGWSQCMDVIEPTSNIDLLPTLCRITGRPIPEWVEGRVLPGFGAATGARSIFALDAKTNSAFTALTSGSFAVIREGYKLIRYQYPKIGIIHELYDLSADAEELNDLSKAKPSTLKELAHELDQAVEEANADFVGR